MELEEKREEKHQLIFHPKWEKGISLEDRELIYNLYEEHGAPEMNQIKLIPIRAGINYKQHLFATVLIQNGADTPLQFMDKEIFFRNKDEIQFVQVFHIPDLMVKGNCSTPWTFIFDQIKLEDDKIDWTAWNIQLEENAHN